MKSRLLKFNTGGPVAARAHTPIIHTSYHSHMIGSSGEGWENAAAAADGLWPCEDSREMTELSRIFQLQNPQFHGPQTHQAQDQAPPEANPRLVQMKRVELTAKVMLFSMQSGKSVSECERLDITPAELHDMDSDATRLYVLTLKMQSVEGLLAALPQAPQRPSTTPIATANASGSQASQAASGSQAEAAELASASQAALCPPMALDGPPAGKTGPPDSSRRQRKAKLTLETKIKQYSARVQQAGENAYTSTDELPFDPMSPLDADDPRLNIPIPPDINQRKSQFPEKRLLEGQEMVSLQYFWTWAVLYVRNAKRALSAKPITDAFRAVHKNLIGYNKWLPAAAANGAGAAVIAAGGAEAGGAAATVAASGAACIAAGG